jgi:hypothetical protein
MLVAPFIVHSSELKRFWHSLMDLFVPLEASFVF